MFVLDTEDFIFGLGAADYRGQYKCFVTIRASRRLMFGKYQMFLSLVEI
jgi:hypothetical protein